MENFIRTAFLQGDLRKIRYINIHYLYASFASYCFYTMHKFHISDSSVVSLINKTIICRPRKYIKVWKVMLKNLRLSHEKQRNKF